MQIYILNRARETLATTASIYNDKHTLTLEAGSSSYEFTIDKSDEASHYLDSGNYIVLQDDKGKAWLFTILDYEETHNTKTVYAEDAGIELINKAVDIWKGDGPHPFSYYFDLVTKGTPWKLGVNQLAGLERTLTYEGRDTGLGRLLSILKGFDNAECTFDVTVKMNAPAEFKINVYKQVGNDRSDVQIVYNNELNDITKKESRAEFVTALAGVGGQIQTEDGSEGGNVDFSELEYDKDGFVTKKGDKFLRAVDANRTFNPGQESYIESFYEYDTQSPSELLNRTLSKLKTYSEPQYTYIADVKVIDSSLVLGDTVTILDHDYNPALYLSARVAKLVKSYTDPAQNEIEFTNYRLLNSALADKIARLQVIVNTLPSASRVSAIETNLTKLTKQQDEVIVKVESANGKNTNFYGGSQPESAKQGDSWFYTDEEGNQGIKQYQDGVWVDVISSKFGPKLEADIKQTQDDMQGLSDEVEEARSKAQEAFAKAGFNADEISNVKTATSEVTETLTSTVRQASGLSESLKNVASETASRYSTVSSELSGAKNSLNAKASELASEVASNSANITKANSQLYSQSEGLAKVSQSATKLEQTMTDLSGRVHTVETTASETKEALADAKGNITTLTKRADGTDTKIADTQGRVQTLESRAGKWDLELSKKVDNTTYNAGIQNLGNQINLKANKSDLDGYATKAQLSVESDKITQQAGEIVTVRNLANNANDKIDGLRIGGRNLLKGTSNQFKTITGSNWMNAHTYNNYPYIDLNNFHTGDYLTYSVWVHNTSDVPIRAEIYCFNSSKAHSVTGISNNIISAGNYGWLTVTMQIGANDYHARPSVITTSGQTGSHTIEMREEMLTLGNVRLPWQPSDLDLPATIVSTVTTTTNAKQIVDSSGIYSEVTKLVDTKVGGVTTQLETYKHTVDDTGNKLRDVMGALKLDSNGKLTSNFNELIKTASGVEERYTQLNGKINGIVVGGKNLLDGTATMGNNGVSTITSSSASNWTEGYTFAVKEPTSDGEQYILSFDAMASTNGYRMQNHWYYGGISGSSNPAKKITDQDGNVVSVGGDGATFTTLTTSWKRYWYLIDTGNSGGETRIIIGRLNDRYKTGPGWVKIRKAQLEKGNKPSDWGMSDNDINQKLAEANASIAKTNETIKTVDGNVTTVKNNLDKTKSVVTQLANLFDVTVGDSSISVTNGGVLVKGKQIHIDGQTVIDNASIDGAKIKSLDAGKITTGTLNAASVKVINLDANNIKTGTLSGNNLSLNLDDGTVSFKKGKIVSSNNKLILNIDDGSLAVGDASQRQGMMFNQGKMYMYDQGYFGNSTWNGNVYDWMLEMKKHPYAVLEYSSSFSGTSGSLFGGSGANFHSTSGVAIAYDKDINIAASAGTVSGIFDDWNPMNGHGVFVNENGIAMGADDKLVSIVGGTSFKYSQQGIWNFKPTILVGTNLWTDNVYDHGYNINKLTSDGPNIYMQASALITDTSAAIFNVENGDVEFAIKGNDKNVIINASGHTNNGLIVEGSQNITNWLGCQDLSVRGNKNSVVQTTAGWTKINAYETAEYYFGDLGTAVTDDTSTVRIGIEPLFNETVNTDIPYQVFVTSYGEGYAWVAERGSNYFVIKSSVPGLEIGYEIKAKRKGYENVRLEIDKHMEVNK